MPHCFLLAAFNLSNLQDVNNVFLFLLKTVADQHRCVLTDFPLPSLLREKLIPAVAIFVAHLTGAAQHHVQSGLLWISALSVKTSS